MLAWREVPTDPSAVGRIAKGNMPTIMQVRGLTRDFSFTVHVVTVCSWCTAGQLCCGRVHVVYYWIYTGWQRTLAELFSARALNNQSIPVLLLSIHLTIYLAIHRFILLSIQTTHAPTQLPTESPIHPTIRTSIHIVNMNPSVPSCMHNSCVLSHKRNHLREP